jgi:hypothetical protein
MTKILHPARLLKPHHRGPGKADPLKALTACHSKLRANLRPARALRRGLGRDRCLGRQFLPHLSPDDIIKAPDPLGVLSPRPRDMWSPLEIWGATGPPITAPTPCDGMDMTVHSEHEHGNHALTQHDPSHFTMMTSIPLQQQG